MILTASLFRDTVNYGCKNFSQEIIINSHKCYSISPCGHQLNYWKQILAEKYLEEILYVKNVLTEDVPIFFPMQQNIFLNSNERAVLWGIFFSNNNTKHTIW